MRETPDIPRRAGGGGGGQGIFKADGTRIKNPQSFFKSGRVTEN